jgi:hypothetical protein
MATIAQSIKEEVFTPELIRENEVLKSLSDDQITGIVTLGNNLVSDRLGKKTGETYKMVEKDVYEASGLEQLPGEKYHQYLKRAIIESKKAGDTELTAQLQALKTENEQLKKNKIGEADEVVKSKLSEYETKLKDKDSEVGTYKTKLAKKEAELLEEKQKSIQTKVELHLDKAISGFKFIDIPDVARAATIKDAKAALRAEYNADIVDNGTIAGQLVFRDKETNDIVKNPANGMEPFTEAELLKKHLNPILDHGRQQTGSGTKPPASANGSTTGQFYLNGAKSQVEADEMIMQHLIANGVPRHTKDFETQMATIRTDNQVEKLPFK